jgi:hypothetical protein
MSKVVGASSKQEYFLEDILRHGNRRCYNSYQYEEHKELYGGKGPFRTKIAHM